MVTIPTIELNKVEIDEMIRRSNELLENDKVTDKEKYLLHYKIRTLQEINI